MTFMSSGLVRPHSSKIAFFHRLLDASVILLALAVALEVTHGLEFEKPYVQAGIWAVLVFLMLGNAKQLYGSWRTLPLHEAVSGTVITWCWTAVALVCLAFLSKTSSDFSRAATLVWFGLTPVLLGLSRVCLRIALQFFRASGRNTRTLAIAGKTRLGQQVAEKVASTPWLGMNFIGYYDDRLASRDCKHAANDEEGIGRFDELVQLAREGRVDYIYITLPMKAENRIIELVNALSDTTASVYMVPNFFVFDLLHGKLTSLSVVGPRPHAVSHNEQYRRLIRGYMLRHKVKPGITGWAQINGWRGETETVDKMAMRVKYDLEYVQNWSLWGDLKIIFLTVFKGFVNKNAY